MTTRKPKLLLPTGQPAHPTLTNPQDQHPNSNIHIQATPEDQQLANTHATLTTQTLQTPGSWQAYLAHLTPQLLDFIQPITNNLQHQAIQHDRQNIMQTYAHHTSQQLQQQRPSLAGPQLLQPTKLDPTTAQTMLNALHNLLTNLPVNIAKLGLQNEPNKPEPTQPGD